MSLDQQLRETQQQLNELQEKLVDSESSKAMEEEISKELQQQVTRCARSSRAPSGGPTAISKEVLISCFNQLFFFLGRWTCSLRSFLVSGVRRSRV